MKNSLILFAIIGLACAQQDNKKVEEKAGIEAQANLDAEQELMKKRVQEMEGDLEHRQRFYQTLSGAYEGHFSTSLGEFSTRIRLVPSLAPYTGAERTRTIEEVTNDLTNLFFHVQVLHWASNNPASATGCIFDQTKGDLEKGQIPLVQNSCANLYIINLSTEDNTLDSPAISKKLIEAEKVTNLQLSVSMQPSNNAELIKFNLKKVE